MAAREAVDGYNADVEATVNRWIVDYYSFLAFELFKNEKYTEFCGVRDLLHSVLVRPVEASDVFQTKIRILQFLSRINDGENLRLSFEPDESLSPLESALLVLEDIIQESSLSMPQQDFEKVRTSLKETIVAMFIKNKQFNKAKEMLDKHFTKTPSGKKVVFLGLIKKKSNVHKVIEQMDFQRFKVEMLAFCQTLCPATVPFLQRAATELIGRRLAAQVADAAGPHEQDEATPPCLPQTITIQFLPCEHIVIQRTRLEAAHTALAAGAGERTFAQLEEEVEEEEQARKEDLSRRLSPAPVDSEEAGPFQRDSGSPMEADQPPQTNAVSQTESSCLSETPPGPSSRRPNTVARLVVEPDSQGSLQCTAASQEREVGVGTEEPPQPRALLDEGDSQSLGADNEISIPVRKIRRRANKFSSSSTESEAPAPDSEAESQESLCKTPERKRRKQLAGQPLNEVPEAVCITDATLDSSPELYPGRSAPQTSSTPNKDSAQVEGPSHTKWKVLFTSAKESKDTWSDEESNLGAERNNELSGESISSSAHRKRMWSQSETKNLKEGVKRFGEGAWSKIKSHYFFNDRTNVNLKDRWRTMKKLNMN